MNNAIRLQLLVCAILVAACATYFAEQRRSKTAAATGCALEAITVSDEDLAGTWTAYCNDKTYVCNSSAGGLTCSRSQSDLDEEADEAREARAARRAAESAPASATPASSPDAGAAEPAACDPICSPGYRCHEGACFPVCNPPCWKGTQCAIDRTCRPVVGAAATDAGL